MLLSLLFFLFKPVIKDLAHDVFSGRDFFQKYCSRIDFVELCSLPEDPLQFPDGFDVHLNSEVNVNCLSSVLTDYSFSIPAESEVVVFGETSYILSLLTAKYDLPHRYSVFGVSELVKVSSDATISLRMVTC